eukprot:1470398-Pleurochrysis_carterae.AAC.1
MSAHSWASLSCCCLSHPSFTSSSVVRVFAWLVRSSDLGPPIYVVATFRSSVAFAVVRVCLAGPPEPMPRRLCNRHASTSLYADDMVVTYKTLFGSCFGAIAAFSAAAAPARPVMHADDAKAALRRTEAGCIAILCLCRRAALVMRSSQAAAHSKPCSISPTRAHVTLHALPRALVVCLKNTSRLIATLCVVWCMHAPAHSMPALITFALTTSHSAHARAPTLNHIINAPAVSLLRCTSTSVPTPRSTCSTARYSR